VAAKLQLISIFVNHYADFYTTNYPTMKKLILFSAFLCLAVGAAGIDTRKLEYPIPYIPVEQRATILPQHSICSIAPAAESSDDFITGNGSLRIQAPGRARTWFPGVLPW